MSKLLLCATGGWITIGISPLIHINYRRQDVARIILGFRRKRESIMYQRIMVAVDGSETSQRGLQEAIHLAKDQKARLAIVHVIDIVVVFGAGQFPGTYVEATRELARNTIEHARATAQAAGIEPEIQTREIVTTGYHVGDTIAELARDWKADLLVVGTHGRRGVSRLLIGSVAERIVRAAPCPLLLIRGA
jgi:nucleotide-binding universal stress UspA family protein